MLIFVARMILVNIISQIVHVFGFIRLGRMPNTRKGNEAMPRNGTGRCSCCQHPLQIFDRAANTQNAPLIRSSARRSDIH